MKLLHAVPCRRDKLRARRTDIRILPGFVALSRSTQISSGGLSSSSPGGRRESFKPGSNFTAVSRRFRWCRREALTGARGQSPSFQGFGLQGFDTAAAELPGLVPSMRQAEKEPPDYF